MSVIFVLSAEVADEGDVSQHALARGMCVSQHALARGGGVFAWGCLPRECLPGWCLLGEVSARGGLPRGGVCLRGSA